MYFNEISNLITQLDANIISTDHTDNLYSITLIYTDVEIVLDIDNDKSIIY